MTTNRAPAVPRNLIEFIVHPLLSCSVIETEAENYLHHIIDISI